MNTNKNTPNTVVVICTAHTGAIWIDGNLVPSATAFELKCATNTKPSLKLEAEIASVDLPANFKLNSAAAESILMCISTDDMEKALIARRKGR